MRNLRKDIKEDFDLVWQNFYSVNAAINKIEAMRYADEDNIALSIIFGLRAASFYQKSNNEDRVLYCLNNASKQVSKITEKSELLTFTDEVWDLIGQFEDRKYELYTKPINEHLRGLYNR